MSDKNGICRTCGHFAPCGNSDLPPANAAAQIKGGPVIQAKELAAFFGDCPAPTLSNKMRVYRRLLGKERRQSVTVLDLARIEGWCPHESAGILNAWRTT